MHEISAWLANPVYDAGVLLFQRFGSNNFLKEKFAAGYNDYNRKKLEDELRKICQAAPPETKAEPKKQIAASAPKNEAASAKHRIDLMRKRDYLYRELNELMTAKHYLPEGEDLRVCAVAILTKHRLISEIWASLDFHDEHGYFPVAQQKPQRPPDQEIQYLRQAISKAKKRLKESKCRDAKKTQALIGESEIRLTQLLKQIKDGKAA